MKKNFTAKNMVFIKKNIRKKPFFYLVFYIISEKFYYQSCFLLLEMRRRQVATYAKYGEIYRLKLIRSYAISTSDPKVFQKISNSTTSYLTKASDYKLMRPFIGDGLVTGSGLQWQSHRKAIQPAFSINALRQYIEIIDRKSMEMVETLKMHCNRTKINVDKFSKQLTCDIIMETAMGIDTSKRNDKVIEFSRAVEL